MNENHRPGLLFVVAAPSGAGKTSLCKALLERLRAEDDHRLEWSCSYTTRPARKGEIHGQDYFFIDDQTFDQMVAADEFAEWALVHGRRYGTSRAYLEKAQKKGRDLLIEIDIQGAKTLRGSYREACFIFILPPDWPTLEQRLRGRGTEPEPEVKRRLITARGELLEWAGFDYIIVNDIFESAVDRLRAVVLARRQARETMRAAAERLIKGFSAPE